jgi:hypothetical protein
MARNNPGLINPPWASLATPNTLLMRDANGRAQVADPSAASDVDTKGARDAAIAAAVNAVYDIPVGWTGLTQADCYFFYAPVTRALRLPASLNGSRYGAVAAATASYTATIYKNGVSKGTIVWGAGGSVTAPTITFSSDVDYAAGDILAVQGQTTPDATLSYPVANLKALLL